MFVVWERAKVFLKKTMWIGFDPWERVKVYLKTMWIGFDPSARAIPGLILFATF